MDILCALFWVYGQAVSAISAQKSWISSLENYKALFLLNALRKRWEIKYMIFLYVTKKVTFRIRDRWSEMKNFEN